LSLNRFFFVDACLNVSSQKVGHSSRARKVGGPWFQTMFSTPAWDRDCELSRPAFCFSTAGGGGDRSSAPDQPEHSYSCK